MNEPSEQAVLPRWAMFRRLAALAATIIAGLSACGALLSALGGPVRPAYASTLTYPGCAPTIQDCLDSAPVGATLIISPGTYITSLTLSQAVNLTGVNSATTIIQALTGQRVLTVTGVDIDNSIVISGLTFTGGSVTDTTGCPAGCGGGVLITNQAQPRLEDITVISNSARLAGGGLYASGPLSLKDSLFENNQCLVIQSYPCDGGALNVVGSLAVTDSQFVSNTSTTNGGAIYALGPVTVTNAVFQLNTCAYIPCQGGALFANGSAFVVSSRFYTNTAGYLGGGMMAHSATVQDGSFVGNKCFYSILTLTEGGGLFAYSVVLTGTQFVSNTADRGGGLSAYSATLNAGWFENNQALFGDGGGVYAGVGFEGLISAGTQFLSNTAHLNGGGVSAGQATLSGGLIQGNSCTQSGCFGGGVYGDSSLALSDVTIFSNSARTNGGGVYANSDMGASLKLRAQTFGGSAYAAKGSA